MSVISSIEKADKALKKLEYADKILYNKVIDILENNLKDSSINMNDTTLAIIEDELFKVLNKSSFFDDIQGYLSIYNDLDESYIDEITRANNLKKNEIKKLLKEDVLSKKIYQTTKYSLSKQGVTKSFINAIADLVREQNYYNRSIQDARKLLKEKILENSATTKYINQVAIDSIRQYDGAYNDVIRKTYGFEKILYIGDLIETSRPLCWNILENYDGRLTIVQLKSILDEYCPNGNPSKSKITIDGKDYRKGAGMYENTNVDNFSQFCGGYRCRHRALPTK